MRLPLKYACFALLASLVNIASQDATLRVWCGAYALHLSIFTGTLCGLVVKYVLDKKYIFRYRARGAADDFGKFLKYTLMSVLTTLIFWGFEYGFEALFGGRLMRYTGAALGLGLGYWLKYRLDKRFVFKEAQ